MIPLPWKKDDKILEVGGGEHPWFRPNLDIRCLPTVDIVADFRKSLPFEAEELDGVFSKFSCENLTLTQLKSHIRDVLRVLKIGGSAVFITNNLYEQLKQIFQHPFNDESISKVFGNNSDCHKVGFNPEYVGKLFMEAGFTRVIVSPWENITGMTIEATKLVQCEISLIPKIKEEMPKKPENTSLKLTNADNFDSLFFNTEPNEVYVDVGSFDGETCKTALKINPELRVIAIEPQPDMANTIKKKLPNITVINKAVMNKVGKTILYTYPNIKGLTTLNKQMTSVRNMFGEIRETLVETDTLDNILISCGVDKVDYIKIDTEGSEEQVLTGFTKYHKGTQFHIEFHPINLGNILNILLEKQATVKQITMHRDSNVNEHVIGYVTGEF